VDQQRVLTVVAEVREQFDFLRDFLALSLP
jgi:hypothetical protein